MDLQNTERVTLAGRLGETFVRGAIYVGSDA